MNPLLEAKYDFINQLRGRLDIHQATTSLSHDMAADHWTPTLPGGLGRLIPTPVEESFTLGVGFLAAGALMENFDVPHTMEVFVVHGCFDLRLGDGPWLPQAQGSAYVLAPGQCHSLRCHERAYLISKLAPPLPVALPPVEHCS